MSGKAPRATAKFSRSALHAGLIYVAANQSCIRRVPSKTGFRYVNGNGRTITDARVLARIKALVIPPAWGDVRICREPRGHLQATGRDARGRKQYRYHADWRAFRDQTKFDRTIEFGRSLGRLRRRIQRDLRRRGLPKEKVIATIVDLLQTTLIRVGNEVYTRQNNSFGLTTLRDNHADINGGAIRFVFRGKGGIRHVVRCKNRRLARTVQRCRDLPGQELFQYLDERGRAHALKSDDVNDYVRQATGQDFTAKDFRTWAGTVLAMTALKEVGDFESKAQAKRKTLRAIEQVASRLGNTCAVCRKSYVHPVLLEAYLARELNSGTRMSKAATRETDRLSAEERELLYFLEKHSGRRAKRVA